MVHVNESHVAGQGARISHAEFVRTWQTAENVDEVCEKLDMTKATAMARAAAYRASGIKLKLMKRNAKRSIKVRELNELIHDLNEELGIPEEQQPKRINVNLPAAQEVVKLRRIRTLRELLKH